MGQNPLEPGIAAGASKLRADLEAIERTARGTPPVGRRLLTPREKLLASLATPASQWTPAQAVWVLRELRRLRGS